jgi:FtsP/CotA-like multicopper oxidase with cupredoxin domain
MSNLLSRQQNHFSRRNLIKTGTALFAGSIVSSRSQAANIPEVIRMTTVETQQPLIPKSGPEYKPVVTLNGWSLPFRMNGDWKEFHLLAEPIEREFAPGMITRLWGYNGQAPGPTLEGVEGDKVRIYVTNKLQEHTSIHWHGLLLPAGMDGVGGITQPHIPPGRTFVYEFELKRSGTFMYHSHSDEMVQMAMGMMGMFIVHPKEPNKHQADRDYLFMLGSYRIEPGSYLPKVSEMLDFNIWSWNNRVFPGIDPFIAKTGDRVRIRIANLTMTNHPIHMHGHYLTITGTDGGWVPETAQFPEATADIAVGSTRAFEFTAEYPGDWPIHCHKAHHTMNAMGHDLYNFIGIKKDKKLDAAIRKLAPGYMPMDGAGMSDMGSMQMALPKNTLPMMSGAGAFGPAEMGGMFSLIKIREKLDGTKYYDPGKYDHPAGTVAHDVDPTTAPKEDMNMMNMGPMDMMNMSPEDMKMHKMK